MVPQTAKAAPQPSKSVILIVMTVYLFYLLGVAQPSKSVILMVMTCLFYLLRGNMMLILIKKNLARPRLKIRQATKVIQRKIRQETTFEDDSPEEKDKIPAAGHSFRCNLNST